MASWKLGMDGNLRDWQSDLPGILSCLISGITTWEIWGELGSGKSVEIISHRGNETTLYSGETTMVLLVLKSFCISCFVLSWLLNPFIYDNYCLYLNRENIKLWLISSSKGKASQQQQKPFPKRYRLIIYINYLWGTWNSIIL